MPRDTPSRRLWTGPNTALSNNMVDIYAKFGIFRQQWQKNGAVWSLRTHPKNHYLWG